MSLDVLAQNLASRGRNGDSMLVHMTPGEVHGLHALALAHGGQLTINPETGLPEANFLKKLLPMIAGAALNFFAPGIGTAIGGALGLGGAAGSAIAVGGITGLATGSLQKGLMAGLGAYGGAGLAEGLTALGAQGAASQLAEQGIAAGAQENARDALLARLGQETAIPTGLEAAKAGLAAAAKDPSSLMAALGGGKQALQYAAMAASPIMADAMVPTTTGMPSSKPGDTGYVRPFVYNPNFGPDFGSLQALAPIPANQITYPAPPPGGANGGLVAFAAGGPVMPSDIGKYTADQKADLYNKFLSQGFGDAAIRQAAGTQTDSDWQTLQNLAAQRGSPDISGAQRHALTTSGWQSKSGETGLAGLNSNIVRWFAENPNATRQQVESEMGKWQLSDADIQRATGQSLNQRFTTQAPAVAAPVAAAPVAAAPVAAPAPAAATNMDKYRELNQLAVQIAQAPAAARQTGTAVGALPSSALTAVKNDTVAQYLNDKFLTDDERRAMRLMLDVSNPGGVQAIYDTINAYDPSGGIAKSLGYTAPAAPAAPAAAPATSTVAPGPVTGGTVTGGGVFTSRTDTTPTFQLPPAEQVMKTPVGTITGGTVTGAVDTKKALDDYNRTAPTGEPPKVIDAGTRLGHTGTDKTYGGTDKLDPIKLADLGKAGSVTRGTETMQDVRNAVGNRYAAPVFQYTPPSVTGASKSAYDYLMGQGAYPTQQTLPGNAPLWRPYVQNVTTPPSASDAFVSRTAPTTATTGGAQFGFTPPTGSTGTPVTGTQRWRNSKTGEIYLAPSGYQPPSGDWVLDTQSSTLTDQGLDPNSPGDTGGATGGLTSLAGGGRFLRGGGTGTGVGGDNAKGGRMRLAMGGYAQGGYNLGSYSDGGRLLRGPGDGVSDSIPATIGRGQPARLADGEFVIPARIVSELGNGSTEAGARKLYAMMDRVQRARRKTTGKKRVAVNTKAERLLPA